MTQLTLNIENTDFIEQLKEFISKFEGVSIAKRVGKAVMAVPDEVVAKNSKYEKDLAKLNEISETWDNYGKSADEIIDMIYDSRQSGETRNIESV